MQTNYKINIYGSTGKIGSKTLKILKNYFPRVKVNLLVANNNYKKLILQTQLYKPKYVCILNKKKYSILKKNINLNKTKLIEPDEIYEFINNSKSDFSILAISGYHALNFIIPIFSNTKNLGIVNKESIVSAGHLFKKLLKKYKINLTPLDSEHYSLFNFFKNNYKSNFNEISKIYLTASGGPFLNYKTHQLYKVPFNKVVKHPKWNMGYKNSIDSATMVNKCLEIIEAHYIFGIDFKKLDILIHPEALVHSIIEYKDHTSILNYFHHDMSIPIYNFLSSSINKKKLLKINNESDFSNKLNINFSPPNQNQFPILKIFNEIEKSDYSNFIKFNCANEFAVNLFSKKLINFGDIHKIIEKSLLLDFDNKINDVKHIIEYQKMYFNLLKSKFD